jgi:predicted XRE-type DNA-binding protein
MSKTFIKTQLSVEIYKIFTSMDVTQEEFAKLLNIKQAKVSRIMNGHMGEFSIETLVEYLQHLGKYVEFKILDSKQ